VLGEALDLYQRFFVRFFLTAAAVFVFVDLLAAIDVLCVLSNCPQINNPCNGFDPTPIEVTITSAAGA